MSTCHRAGILELRMRVMWGCAPLNGKVVRLERWNRIVCAEQCSREPCCPLPRESRRASCRWLFASSCCDVRHLEVESEMRSVMLHYIRYRKGSDLVSGMEVQRCNE